MPNWCNNSFAITGNIESIKDLWDSAQTADNGEFGLLSAIMPMPKELEGTTAPSKLDEEEQAALLEKYGAADWYQWRVNNWGTKWDVSDEGLEFIDNEDGTACITGWFDSAWAPPIGAYEQLADDFDSCVIECSFHEPGMDFAGFWSSENGEEYCEDLTEQCELPEDDRSDLFNQLDEEYALVENYEMWKEEEEVDLTPTGL